MASFDVINIKLAQINLFLSYIFYIHMHVKNILDLAQAAREATSAKRQAPSAEQHKFVQKKQLLDEECDNQMKILI